MSARIWGKNTPHIKKIVHNGYGWAADFHCGHSRFVSNEQSIAMHEKKLVPVCDVLNCSGWPKPGDPLTTLERWTENGQPRCTSVSPFTDRHQCQWPAGHLGGHTSACGKFEWADNPKAAEVRHRQAAADLETLAGGSRLGPDATSNARTVQDTIDRLKAARLDSDIAFANTLQRAYNADLSARMDREAWNVAKATIDEKLAANTERQKFEASATESLVRLEQRINDLSAQLTTRKAQQAQTDEKLKALTQHVTNLEHALKGHEERLIPLETESRRFGIVTATLMSWAFLDEPISWLAEKLRKARP